MATVRLANTGINEMEGHLASGMVKAIKDLLNELKMGSIKGFETNEKQVLVYKHQNILSALICDIGDDLDLITDRLQQLTHMFVEDYDWSKWTGNRSSLAPLVEKAKNILKIPPEHIAEHVKNHMEEIISSSSDILGYKILISNIESSQNIEKITDFETKAFLESTMFSLFVSAINEVEKASKELNLSKIHHSTFLDFEKFSILKKNIFSGVELYVFLNGFLDPLLDLPKIEENFNEIGGF